MTEAVLSGWHGVAAWRLPSRWWGIPSSMRSLGGTPALRRYSELGGAVAVHRGVGETNCLRAAGCKRFMHAMNDAADATGRGRSHVDAILPASG